MNVYGNKKFAKLLKTHKEVCNNLIDKFCFMVVFRYNLIMRSNSFSFCVGAKQQAVSNISQKRNDIVQECLQTVCNFREIDWQENLYAPGQAYFNIDPLTSQPQGRISYQSLAAHHPLPYMATPESVPYHGGEHSNNQFSATNPYGRQPEVGYDFYYSNNGIRPPSH
ncbi:hypothetical protein PCANC_27826 [Puccinia coronata f. sp. avenae]|uniref:Uncharacterized protein n=1 Tax=Puccinia coronata f. sp. avenae TaxID=200324 RepID=A0A2N5TB85_9BASI|nr:hypothetical protein PCANC_27826 [Puccinia coronata f. sp. avenae]